MDSILGMWLGFCSCGFFWIMYLPGVQANSMSTCKLALLLVGVTTPNSYNAFGIYHYISEFLCCPIILAFKFCLPCFKALEFHNIVNDWSMKHMHHWIQRPLVQLEHILHPLLQASVFYSIWHSLSLLEFFLIFNLNYIEYQSSSFTTLIMCVRNLFSLLFVKHSSYFTQHRFDWNQVFYITQVD